MNQNNPNNASHVNIEEDLELTLARNDSQATNHADVTNLPNRESSSTETDTFDCIASLTAVSCIEVIRDETGPPVPMAMFAESLQSLSLRSHQNSNLKSSQKGERLTRLS